MSLFIRVTINLALNPSFEDSGIKPNDNVNITVEVSVDNGLGLEQRMGRQSTTPIAMQTSTYCTGRFSRLMTLVNQQPYMTSP